MITATAIFNVVVLRYGIYEVEKIIRKIKKFKSLPIFGICRIQIEQRITVFY